MHAGGELKPTHENLSSCAYSFIQPLWYRAITLLHKGNESLSENQDVDSVSLYRLLSEFFFCSILIDILCTIGVKGNYRDGKPRDESCGRST
jgi:hypothetical protein